MDITKRAGRIINTTNGYKAYIPAKLPPVPPIFYDPELQNLLSLADRKLGRLDGITQILPNPELFVAMYVKKEAVLSSQIEGTQASLADILEATDKMMKKSKLDNVNEVLNYVSAMNWGLLKLDTLPLCLRLIKELHYKLLADTRGGEKSPG